MMVNLLLLDNLHQVLKDKENTVMTKCIQICTQNLRYQGCKACLHDGMTARFVPVVSNGK